MAKIFRYLLILLNLHQIYSGSVAETEDLQKKFTSKCDDLCINQNENGTTKVILRWCYQIVTDRQYSFIHVYSFVFPTKDFGKSECLRGCQYFNIEFLLNARNKDKTVDLNQLVERCGSCKYNTILFISGVFISIFLLLSLQRGVRKCRQIEKRKLFPGL